MTRPGTIARFALAALVFALVILPHFVSLRFGRGRLASRTAMIFHRSVLRLFSVRVTQSGTPPADTEPALVLSNHVSWLDIVALGALRPLSFVGKSEIDGWPVIGTFARLQRTIFVDRSRRGATAQVNAAVAQRLAAGGLVVLFAEGTTGDGMRLLPFRSSLVGAARAALAAASSPEQVLLQPLAIAYTRRRGLPVTRRERPQIAWYGDMELAPHVMGFVREGPLDVEVTWGVPIAFGPGTDRKHATAEAEAEVRRALRAFGSSGASRPLFSCRAGRPM